MTFAAPWWFWGFAIFPFLIALAAASERRRRELLKKIVAARLAPRLAGTVSLAKRRLRFGFLLLALAALILTLARPQWGFTWDQAKRKGRDVLIAIDTSRSMLADDLKPSRLARAKLAAQDLISELRGDRVGIVAFAGTSFLQAPLTIDYGAVLNSLKELDTEVIPQGGSNLEGAIKAARDAFGKGESENRALIIFSDGEELDANAEKAVEDLKGQVRIFAVGLGSPEGALIPVRGRTGGTEFVKDAEGNVVRTKLDETRLRAIAEPTGGFYVHLQTGRPEMQQIVQDGLGKMTEQEIDAKLSRRPIERYQWPLSSALLFLFAAMTIGERRRGAALRPVAAALLLGFVPFGASAKNDGVAAYERQDYAGARKEFTKQLGRRPDLPELEFNLGSSAYKAGDYDAALSAFSRALTSPDPQLRTKAAHNLGNTLFQRGAAQQEKKAKISEWKNALQHYDEALKADPQNQDAEYNRDVVRRLIEQLEQEPPKQDDKKDQKQDQDKDKQDQNKDQQSKDQKQQQQQSQKQDQQNQQDQQQQQGGGQQKDKQDQQQQQQQQQQQSGGKGQQDEKKQDGSQQPPQKDQNEQGKNEKQDQQASADGEKPEQKNPGKDQKEQKDQQNGKDSPKDRDQQQKEGKDGKDGKQDPAEAPPAQPGEKKEGELKSAPEYGQGQEQSPEEQAAAEAQAAAEGKMTPQQARALLESLKGEDEKVRLLDPRERRQNRRVFKDW